MLSAVLALGVLQSRVGIAGLVAKQQLPGVVHPLCCATACAGGAVMACLMRPPDVVAAADHATAAGKKVWASWLGPNEISHQVGLGQGQRAGADDAGSSHSLVNGQANISRRTRKDSCLALLSEGCLGCHTESAAQPGACLDSGLPVGHVMQFAAAGVIACCSALLTTGVCW